MEHIRVHVTQSKEDQLSFLMEVSTPGDYCLEIDVEVIDEEMTPPSIKKGKAFIGMPVAEELYNKIESAHFSEVVEQLENALSDFQEADHLLSQLGIEPSQIKRDKNSENPNQFIIVFKKEHIRTLAGHITPMDDSSNYDDIGNFLSMLNRKERRTRKSKSMSTERKHH